MRAETSPRDLQGLLQIRLGLWAAVFLQQDLSEEGIRLRQERVATVCRCLVTGQPSAMDVPGSGGSFPVAT